MRSAAHLVFAGLLLTALAVGLVGCFDPFSPRIAVTQAISEPAPSPLSPTGVIELFQWCYRHRNYSVYRELFTADYVFTFSALDPSGEPYKDKLWRREDELDSANHLFITGNATEEPATSITLDFGNSLLPINDQRPGKTAKWHKQITVDVVLDVTRPTSALQVKGGATFYVVRQDSAQVPPELNLPADTLRWFIERWEDNTQQQAQGARVRPAGGAERAVAPATPLPTPTYTLTFGGLKKLYR